MFHSINIIYTSDSKTDIEPSLLYVHYHMFAKFVFVLVTRGKTVPKVCNLEESPPDCLLVDFKALQDKHVAEFGQR